MRPLSRARMTERQVCAFLGKRHLGGPGEPDCVGGGVVVEVKDQKRRVSAHQMERILERPWAEGKPLIVASTSGFSPMAKDVAAEFDDVFLYKVYPGGRSRRISIE